MQPAIHIGNMIRVRTHLRHQRAAAVRPDRVSWRLSPRPLPPKRSQARETEVPAHRPRSLPSATSLFYSQEIKAVTYNIRYTFFANQYMPIEGQAPTL